MKYYLETKIKNIPDFEATLLRKHFANAKSQAEIDENFANVYAMVQEKRDNMRKVQPIPVAKVNETAAAKKPISGGETIVKENGGQYDETIDELEDDSYVNINFDGDVISNEEMLSYMAGL